MNTFYMQHRAVARVWAVLTMFAVLLSAFSAPLSVAFAQEPEPAAVEAPVAESEPEVPPQDVVATPEASQTEVPAESTPISEPEPEVPPQDVVATPEASQTEVPAEPELVVEVQQFAAREALPVTLIEPEITFVPSCKNLFENGSFEEPEVTDASLWQKFSSVTGWLIERVSDLSPITLEVHRGWNGNSAAAGAQYVELDGDHSAQVSQTVNTIPGAIYELTWAFAPRHNIAAEQNKMDVLVNGGLVGSNGPETGSSPLMSGDWAYTSVNFVATTTETTFTFRDMGESNSYGTFLDDAKLCLVDLPEPKTRTITACKYDATENPLSGWSMTVTNNQEGENLVSYNLETGEDGCVSSEVDPTEGPFYVTEENRVDWDQIEVWSEGGRVEEGEGSSFCSFFNPIEEYKLSARTAEMEVERFSCNFVNKKDVISAPVCKADVNLIQNGSFETPDIPEDGFGWDIYDSTVGGLVWVVDWLNPVESSPTPAKLELQGGYYAASNGVQYAELDSNWNAAPGGPYNGEDTRVSIYQDILTIPGNTYTVSYDFSALPRRGAETNILQVLLDEIQVAQHSADGIGQTDTVWTTYSYSFVATSTESRVGFADAGLADSFGTLIDNVSVYCNPTVPEEEVETPTSGRRGGGSGTLVRPKPAVAGDSISVPSPAPLVLGEQVTAVPYGAPGTGNGGSSHQNSLTLGNLLFLASRRQNLK